MKLSDTRSRKGLQCLDKDGMVSVHQPHVMVDGHHFDGLLQDCSISVSNALDILQFGTKPSMWFSYSWMAIVISNILINIKITVVICNACRNVLSSWLVQCPWVWLLHSDIWKDDLAWRCWALWRWWGVLSNNWVDTGGPVPKDIFKDTRRLGFTLSLFHSFCLPGLWRKFNHWHYIIPGYEIVRFAGVWSCVQDHTCWSWEEK